MNDFMFFWVLVFVANVGLALLVANVARQKNYSGIAFFFLSFFFSFLVGILVVLAMPKRAHAGVVGETGSFFATNSGTMVKCPLCAELIKADAKICKHCKSDVAEQIRELASVEADRIRRAELEADQLASQKIEARRQFILRVVNMAKSKTVLAGLAVTVLAITSLTVMTLGNNARIDEIRAKVLEFKGFSSKEQFMNSFGAASRRCGISNTQPILVDSKWGRGDASFSMAVDGGLRQTTADFDCVMRSTIGTEISSLFPSGDAEDASVLETCQLGFSYQIEVEKIFGPPGDPTGFTVRFFEDDPGKGSHYGSCSSESKAEWSF